MGRGGWRRLEVHEFWCKQASGISIGSQRSRVVIGLLGLICKVDFGRAKHSNASESANVIGLRREVHQEKNTVEARSAYACRSWYPVAGYDFDLDQRVRRKRTVQNMRYWEIWVGIMGYVMICIDTIHGCIGGVGQRAICG